MRLIDADALYKKLDDIRKEEILLHGRMNNKYCCTLSTALYEIDNAPTIEPQRKKGKWIRITQGSIPEIYICPFCNRTLKDTGIDSLVHIRYPFCHCGADMREED